MTTPLGLRPLSAFSLLTFKDKSEISIGDNGDITISNEGEFLSFNDYKNIVEFDSGTGEKVIEYTGLDTDQNERRSWAKAFFEPNATSPKHFHKERVEDYYVTSPNTEILVVVDDHKHFLKTGDHLQIMPNQHHQVFNLSTTEQATIVVKCTPAWSVDDHHLS